MEAPVTAPSASVEVKPNPVLGFRRLGFCAAVLVASVWALATVKINATQWLELMKWLTTAYLASDGVEKVSTAVGRGKAATLAPTGPGAPAAAPGSPS